MPKQFNLFSKSYKKEKNHVLSMILKLDKVKIFKKGNMEKKIMNHKLQLSKL